MSECACFAILGQKRPIKMSENAGQWGWMWVKVETEQTKTGETSKEKARCGVFHLHTAWANACTRASSDSALCKSEIVRATNECVHTPSHTRYFPLLGYEPSKKRGQHNSAWCTQRRAKCSATGGDGSLDLCPPLTVLYTCWLRTCPSCETLKISRYKFMKYKIVYTWDCPFRTFSGLYSNLRIGGGPSMDQSGLSSCCAFLVTSYHSSSGVFIASGERSFCMCSCFVSLTFLGDFQTLLW